MARTIEFEVKIKGGDGGVLKNITVEVVNADDAIKKIVDSASKAADRLQPGSSNAFCSSVPKAPRQ